MKDRVPANPGRVLITPEDGSASFYATMARADNPTQEGDPLNKNTLLKDATAALFGLRSDAVPDDALAKIKQLIDEARSYTDSKAQIEAGYYSGTGTYGSTNPNSLTFDFAPKILMVFQCSTTDINGEGSFVRPDGYDNYFIQVTSLMTTSFNAGRGFGGYFNDPPYGKKSSDGKTISWYQSGGAKYQLNSSGIEFGYLAIG